MENFNTRLTRLDRNGIEPDCSEKTDSSVYKAATAQWWDEYLRYRLQGLLKRQSVISALPTAAGSPVEAVDCLVTLAAKLFLGNPLTNPSLLQSVREFRNQGLLGSSEDVGVASKTTDDPQLQLLFALLGCVSMLFESAPTDDLGHLVIKVNRDPWNNAVPSPCFLQTQEAIQHVSMLRPDYLLRQFGYILPPAPPSLLESTFATHELATRQRPNLLSAPLVSFWHLAQIGNIEIEWTQVLGYHLQLNHHTRTLQIFAVPSYCHMILVTDRTQLEGMNKLYGNLMCGATSWEKTRYRHIQDLMREVLLGYRLIFGQDRRHFSLQATRHLSRLFTRPWLADDPDMRFGFDPLLKRLCLTSAKEQRSFFDPLRLGRSKGCYNTEFDFPLLEGRLLELQRFMS